MTEAGRGFVEKLGRYRSLSGCRLVGLRLVCVLKLECPSSEAPGGAIWWLEKGEFAEKFSVTCFSDESPKLEDGRQTRT
jgi:hypothetical protein